MVLPQFLLKRTEAIAFKISRKASVKQFARPMDEPDNFYIHLVLFAVSIKQC